MFYRIIHDTLEKLNTYGENAITSVYQFPSLFGVDFNTTTNIPFGILFPQNINGYIPQNKKVLSHLYLSLSIQPTDSAETTIFPQFFSIPFTCTFNLYNSKAPAPSAFGVPTNYLGGERDIQGLFNYNSFPTPSLAGSLFSQYLNYNSLNNSMDAVGNIISTLKSGGGLFNTAANFVNRAENLRLAHQFSIASSPSGNYSRNGANYNGVWFQTITPTNNSAQVLDDYFTKYGYAQKRIASPILRARPSFTYIQTKDMILKGKIPQQYKTEIENIFDTGITWWTSPDIVGDYSQDNSPS